MNICHQFDDVITGRVTSHEKGTDTHRILGWSLMTTRDYAPDHWTKRSASNTRCANICKRFRITFFSTILQSARLKITVEVQICNVTRIENRKNVWAMRKFDLAQVHTMRSNCHLVNSFLEVCNNSSYTEQSYAEFTVFISKKVNFFVPADLKSG